MASKRSIGSETPSSVKGVCPARILRVRASGVPSKLLEGKHTQRPPIDAAVVRVGEIDYLLRQIAKGSRQPHWRHVVGRSNLHQSVHVYILDSIKLPSQGIGLAENEAGKAHVADLWQVPQHF